LNDADAIDSDVESSVAKAGEAQPVLLKLDHLEKMVTEISERLKTVEKKLVSEKK